MKTKPLRFHLIAPADGSAAACPDAIGAQLTQLAALADLVRAALDTLEEPIPTRG